MMFEELLNKQLNIDEIEYLFGFFEVSGVFPKNKYILLDIKRNNQIFRISVNASLNDIENKYGSDVESVFSNRKPKKNIAPPVEHKNLEMHEPDSFLDVFLQIRKDLEGFVLVEGPSTAEDGFGGWARGIAAWLMANNFEARTTYPSDSQWNQSDIPVWSITIGPVFWGNAPGEWKTLFTCVDETTLESNEPSLLSRYDEVWVPLPCQIQKIESFGYVGKISIIRPQIKWAVNNVDEKSELIWVGTDVERKQKDLMREWKKEKNFNISEINRWQNMLTESEYRSKILQSKGLITTSKSEGYGMPIREFAFSGLPVYGIPLPEYDNLIFPANNSNEIKYQMSLNDKQYILPSQLQNPIRRIEKSNISGWFPGPTRCGVQAHHQGVCEKLGIPVFESRNHKHKLFTTFHEFYSERFFSEIPHKNIAVIDIHSISETNKIRLLEIFGNNVRYIGHRENHVNGLPNAYVLPLLTRATRTNCQKENIVYHTGLLSYAKNYDIFFQASDIDNSDMIWKIDISIPHFYKNKDIEYFIKNIEKLNNKYRKVIVRFEKFSSDEERYVQIERSKICVNLYQTEIKLKDSSAMINDAIYLKTPCVCNSNWISEWDKLSVHWNDSDPNSLLNKILEAKDIVIDSVLNNHPDIVIDQYRRILYNE